MRRLTSVLSAMLLLAWMVTPAAGAAPKAPSCTVDDWAWWVEAYGFLPGTVNVEEAGPVLNVHVVGIDKADHIEVMWNGSGLTITADFLDAPREVAVAAGVSNLGVWVAGCAGSDHITFNDAAGPQLWYIASGDGGNDHITGGDASEYRTANFFHGGDGNDQLTAGDASGLETFNTLIGGNGNDRLTAGNVTGAESFAELYGEDGNDQLTAGTATGLSANDVDGGADRDRCVGGSVTDFTNCEVEQGR